MGVYFYEKEKRAKLVQKFCGLSRLGEFPGVFAAIRDFVITSWTLNLIKKYQIILFYQTL